MIDIDPTLTGGGDCHLHYHQSDRVPRQDTLHGLQMVTRGRTLSTDTTLTVNDDIAICSSSMTVTLPIAKGGREFEVVKSFDGGYVQILPTYPDKILGADGVSIYNKGTAIRLKATDGGYIAL